MNLERLNRLADHLDTVAPAVFNLLSWYTTIVKNECGYTACAIGHACEIPEFKAAGLVLADYLKPETDESLLPPMKVPQLGSRVSWDAVEEFFGLDYWQALYLFTNHNYRSYRNGPKDVARHIRTLIECEGDVSAAKDIA